MKYKSIFFISPPFYSHFNPLLNLAKSFKKAGVDVTIGCSVEFKKFVVDEGLKFYEIDISSNKNIQKAESTDQPDTEKERLDEFFESTKEGAIETLITQSRHRKADMLYDPHKLIENIKMIDETVGVDLYVVDILSYSVTLALYSLNLDFITYCPPHPYTIPDDEMNYGVPKYWLSAIRVEKNDEERLKEVSKSTQKEFTEVFNQIISEKNKVAQIDNAFRLVSDIAVIYNYFDFNEEEETENMPYKIYAGNSFEEKELDSSWKKIVDHNEMKILITLGTFLSNRKDVLKKLIEYTKEKYPEAMIIVSAGENTKELEGYASSKIIIKDFIPQIALMPYVDLVIFHGGCNTFTEAMYYGKDMIVLPFSSDQFNIAHDIEKNDLGVILDPNHFNQNDMKTAFEKVEDMSRNRLKYFSEMSQNRGTDYATKIILGTE
ncbi:glycosyltransferase [Jeotgalibaca sp. MA1X17-3]|uniref:glycosyltransferase n=1 Tax=Jeotgalibaca sp. MA1X17-3 TaxID=2908211 RepID=UPI001F2B3635|nr:glycosyltransferase [Jeotgalibaca sp. MA1X17-3]UJF16466.1 glycosyltransferase [Jeotgalibaca sp. MA1X17-3]